MPVQRLSPAAPWAPPMVGTFMVARMFWRSLSWMGWWEEAGLPNAAAAAAAGAAVVVGAAAGERK